MSCYSYGGVSTHDLTKRSTTDPRELDVRFEVSTHDLTKRSTAHHTHNCPNLYRFNSRPHEEVDDAERYFAGGNDVSTHDLTKRSTWKSLHTGQVITVSTHDLTKRSTLSL